MNEPRSWRPSVPFLSLCIVLLAAGVFLIGGSVLQGARESAQVGAVERVRPPQGTPPSMADEAKPVAIVPAVAVEQAPAGRRHLDVYYERRAYPGAPPYVPHEVDTAWELDGSNCNACHLNGGFAPRFEAFVPRTPHPEYLSCSQCHVQQHDAGKALAANRWVKISGPRLGQSAQPAGPPRVPHTLQLRENCQACHAGAGAIAEIATTHAERGNCRQCHVPSLTSTQWSRP